MCHIRCDRNASEGDSQHFLASSAAVTLDIFDIAEMSEEQAESAFEAIRFAQKGGEPHCVWCDCEVAYRITRQVKNRKTGAVTSRRLFKCKQCLKQFSVTSGTIFHSRKLSFRKIMAMTLLYVNGAGGNAGLRLRRDVRSNHKTAWITEHRLREAMTSYVSGRQLTGPVEMDSTEFGGKVRKANQTVDRKKQPRRNADKVTSISALVERGRGGRVVPFLGNEAALVKVIDQFIDANAEPITDEHPCWNALFAKWPVRQIKHKDRYSDYAGTHTNNVESHWSRFKWMYNGAYRHFSGRYGHAYNGECAWRSEHRGRSNGEQFILALAGALHHPPSANWRGYYQRTRKMAA